MTRLALTGVELRHLAALAAIHEERSFRRAAERLGYVQSAVSQQLGQLEALVGCTLVDRVRGDTRPVGLTVAGHTLLRHANGILAQLRAAEADLNALESSREAPLRVGVDATLGTRLVPDALARFAAAHPSATVQLVEAPSDRDHLQAIESGTLDVAFGELPLDGPALRSTAVLDDPSMLVVPRSSPHAASGRPIGLDELAGEPFVKVSAWPMMELIERTARTLGSELRPTMTVLTCAMAQALVGAGVGLAILPRAAIDEDDPRIAAVDLSSALPPRRLVVYHRELRGERPALAAFLAAARSAGRSIGHLRAVRDRSGLVGVPGDACARPHQARRRGAPSPSTTKRTPRAIGSVFVAGTGFPSASTAV